MKRALLYAVFFTTFVSHAQLPANSVAPDFTLVDINGYTRSLSEYLAAGKTVIIDISATWCGPCWNYHESGALEDLYYTYGPGGSDEVVVLFVEGDNLTSVESLYGTNMPGDSGVTQGDWTLHSPYPIINNGDFSTLYQINYFPTIYRICPNGIVNEIPQLDFDGLVDNINTNCETLTGAQQNAKLDFDDLKVCNGNAISPKATITNYGLEPITSATIELRIGDDVLATKEYTGNLAMFDDTTVTFDPVVLSGGDYYKAVVSNINGVAPMNGQTTSRPFAVNETNEGYNDITIKVYTNNYANEISWAIKDGSGEVVVSGGPYQAGGGDMFGGGGPDANTTKIVEATLPGTDPECYSVEMYSSSGYGWIVGDTPHGIEISSASGLMFSQFVANFGSELDIPAAFKTNGLLGVPTKQAPAFGMFPNPTSGLMNLSTTEAVNVVISDLDGKIVYRNANLGDGSSIDLGALQKGMYVARISGEHFQKTEKVIVK
jgi:hypothetical protein